MGKVSYSFPSYFSHATISYFKYTVSLLTNYLSGNFSLGFNQSNNSKHNCTNKFEPKWWKEGFEIRVLLANKFVYLIIKNSLNCVALNKLFFSLNNLGIPPPSHGRKPFVMNIWTRQYKNQLFIPFKLVSDKTHVKPSVPLYFYYGNETKVF